MKNLRDQLGSRSKKKMNEREIREELVKQLEALKYKVDGSPMDSIMAHLWVNKCIEIVRPKD
jgi:hypothetical protein